MRRVLFDEDMPRQLRRDLPEFEQLRRAIAEVAPGGVEIVASPSRS